MRAGLVPDITCRRPAGGDRVAGRGDQGSYGVMRKEFASPVSSMRRRTMATRPVPFQPSQSNQSRVEGIRMTGLLKMMTALVPRESERKVS